jgi:hypothetical protein
MYHDGNGIPKQVRNDKRGVRNDKRGCSEEQRWRSEGQRCAFGRIE